MSDIGSSTMQIVGAHPLPLDEVPGDKIFGHVDADVPAESSAQTCLGTKLPHGIWKPKIYTDGTV
jgi:hypothetical protein